MIKKISTNIVNSGAEVIIHQCNCFNTMGAGVAKVLRDKWPEIYDVDCQTSKGDKSKLGLFSIAKLDDPDSKTKYVLNCYSQYKHGRIGRYTNYEFYYQCLVRVKEFCENNGLTTIAIPFKMGCNLAGGDWNICENMINTIFSDDKIEVLICEF